jgi:hypothetical protein
MAKVAVTTSCGCSISISGFEGAVLEAKTFCFMAGAILSRAGYRVLPNDTISIIRSRNVVLTWNKEEGFNI